MIPSSGVPDSSSRIPYAPGSPGSITALLGRDFRVRPSRCQHVDGESIERFADYSTEELARMLFELERGEDDRLQRLIEQIRAELARRALLQ
jgi:hypothetical protein